MRTVLLAAAAVLAAGAVQAQAIPPAPVQPGATPSRPAEPMPSRPSDLPGSPAITSTDGGMTASTDGAADSMATTAETGSAADAGTVAPIVQADPDAPTIQDRTPRGELNDEADDKAGMAGQTTPPTP